MEWVTKRATPWMATSHRFDTYAVTMMSVVCPGCTKGAELRKRPSLSQKLTMKRPVELFPQFTTRELGVSAVGWP